ncbi:uncharacterized protein LOC107841754 isoform X2 [Capsicum annuum]|uniref:uncharacterized protein LOC107841754 isoform X2 n=1 Tax=Capsicum annuum TaxID=4072 RepID=UPI0007BF6581|nr:uncharacterized protein LOC107841754 isoform X2 [Capsicum annuum]
MDPKYTAETLKHLEKESELLSNAHKTMSDELHRLQKGFNDNAEERQNGREGALVNMTNGADERENGWEAALVDMTDGADERQNDLEGAVS